MKAGGRQLATATYTLPSLGALTAPIRSPANRFRRFGASCIFGQVWRLSALTPCLSFPQDVAPTRGRLLPLCEGAHGCSGIDDQIGRIPRAGCCHNKGNLGMTD